MNRLLFVYGTLMHGCGNHRQLEGAEYLGPAQIDGWQMLDLGAFPGIIPGDSTVRGELYVVGDEQLAALDRFEGCPRLYRRRSVTLWNNGVRVSAQTYVFANGGVGLGLGNRIASGDWRKREARAS